MKRIITMLLALCLAFSLAACTGEVAGESNGNLGETLPAGGFRVGFGRADITPKESIPMASYGNPLNRMSEGLFTYLYINAVAVNDGEKTLLLLTIDHSWFSNVLRNPVLEQIKDIYGIPEEYILFQGTHTHAAPNAGSVTPAMSRENDRTVKGVMKAIDAAMKDLKPAEIYVGSVMTKNMNFVRRYIMDDGSLTGDNFPGTGTKIVGHESEADGEMQIMRFAREGGKDIVICNFQAHPHLEGKNPYLSYQTVGSTRTAVEELLDVHCVCWQGAAGNINTHSRITEENLFTSDDRELYGEAMAQYVASAYEGLTKVQSGPIKVSCQTLSLKVDHSEDDLLGVASKVHQLWDSTSNSATAMAVAGDAPLYSVFHASAIVRKASYGPTLDMTISAFSFGDVSGVIVPYEMFDTNGMQIKSQTPFAKTFICGYSNMGSGGQGYMPDKEAYKNIGYEVNNCNFEIGTAELLVDAYLQMLNELHG